MKINKFRGLLGVLPAAVLLFQCETALVETREVYLDLPATPYTYSPNTAAGDHIPTLGRVLFYDRQLSVNNSISCASCHKQALAFADNVKFSSGFENRLTTRNSMPIQNLTPGFFGLMSSDPNFVRTDLPSQTFNNPASSFFNPSVGTLFWDGREHELSKMALRPIVNHIEMGVTNLDELSKKLEAIPYYQTLFKNAWGSPEVTPQKIGNALQWFMASIESNGSNFDNAKKGGAPLSHLESIGEGLFETKYECNSCHQVQSPHGYLTQGGGFANIGLDAQYSDNGLMETTGNPSDAGKFKIPSLRNVALTAPYMHDGRFATLEEVVDHYSGNMENHPNLDARLRDSGNPKAMDISAFEKQAIVAFLHTLTDTQMIKDQRFSDPFKIK
jgi:cytochrome c peroxidase